MQCRRARRTSKQCSCQKQLTPVGLTMGPCFTMYSSSSSALYTRRQFSADSCRRWSTMPCAQHTTMYEEQAQQMNGNTIKLGYQPCCCSSCWRCKHLQSSHLQIPLPCCALHDDNVPVVLLLPVVVLVWRLYGHCAACCMLTPLLPAICCLLQHSSHHDLVEALGME